MRIFKLFVLALVIFLGMCALIYVITELRVKKFSAKKVVNTFTDDDGSFLQKYSVPQVDSTPILMYHHIRINPDPNNSLEVSLNVSPSNFEKQIRYLYNNHYKTIPLTQLFFAQDPKNNEKNIVITFDDGYKDIIGSAYPILKRYGYSATVFPIVDYIGKTWYLDWSDLSVLESAGWEIGSHTLSHPDLVSLNEEDARKQISESKIFLERSLEKPVETFCYPAGRFNKKVLRFVKDAGYRRAVTTIYGKINQSDEELMLKRVRIGGTDQLPTFISKIE